MFASRRLESRAWTDLLVHYGSLCEESIASALPQILLPTHGKLAGLLHAVPAPCYRRLRAKTHDVKHLSGTVTEKPAQLPTASTNPVLCTRRPFRLPEAVAE
jgi:hypothetical protein